MEHVPNPIAVSIVRTSPNCGALIEALAAAQGEFPLIDKKHTGSVKGEDKNGRPYTYDYKYADLADVLAAVRPVLASHKLAVLQPTYMTGNNLILATRLMHASGEWMESEYPVSQIGAKHQQMGGALTYARRYALCAMLGIAAEEDKDGEAAAEPNRVRARVIQRPSRQERPQEPLSPVPAMKDAIAKAKTLEVLEHIETNPKFEDDFAKLSDAEKEDVRDAITAQRERLSVPVPQDQRSTLPKHHEAAPPHTPGSISSRALGAAQNRQPSRGPAASNQAPSKQLIDDDIPF
jgi:ERF superfamily